MSERGGVVTDILKGMSSDEDVDVYTHKNVGVIRKDVAMENSSPGGAGDGQNEKNDHENDDIDHDGQDNNNEDQTAEDIARQFPIASTEFASNLNKYFSHPSRSFPTLEAGQKSLHKKTQSEGFTIKKKYEHNADKHEGECSQQTKKEFRKMILFSCVCSGKTTRDASIQSKRQRRSLLKKGCPWSAKIKKVGGSYRVKISGEHNHAAIKDISIYPVARRGSPEQELFVSNLIKARTSTYTILDKLRETFNGSCLLNAKDIQNRRQKYRDKQKGLPKMDALMREMIADNVNFRVKQSEEGHITHLIIIPSSVPQLLQEERRTAVVQIDVTYRNDKCGAGMLHIVSSTNTNVTYTLGYCVMETATEKDFTWILYTFVEAGVIIDPGVIITNADQALMNACNVVFTNAKHMLCYWHIQSNIKAQYQRDFPTREVAGATQWTFATFLKEWSNLVINTKTKELFAEGWKEMKEHIPTACAEYIEHRWLDPYKEKFVGAYLTHIKHYGQISSSKVKGAHAAFKKTLGTTPLGVFSVYPKMKIICRAQMERISFLRARETMFLPVVKRNVFMQLYGKISTYALKLMNPEYLAAKMELSKMMNTPRSLYYPLECDGMCMSNFGLCCRHDLLELMSCGDGVDGQVNPMDIDTHWFLEKRFTPRCTTISLPVVPPVKKRKDAPRRLPIEDEVAEKEAKKKRIRCSFCKSYGHNKLSCQARIKAANEKAIREYQQHQQHHLPVQRGTTSTSTAPNVNSLPLHSPRTPVTPIMPPMQMLASLSDDPIRVTAARRQCYQQDYANQDMLVPDLMTDPWIQATQYPSPSQGSATSAIFPSSSDIHGRASDARSQLVQAQQTRSPARDGYHYSQQNPYENDATHLHTSQQRNW